MTNIHKKIFSIGMAKNNADVIESHIRYHLTMLDGMIILENGSTDKTLEILKLLKNEGLPLYILEDTDRKFEQGIKTNKLLLKAVNEFDADIIVPLDVDEFLITTNRGNPRKTLEEIEPNTFYRVKWKTYVPDFTKNENEKFIPAKITMVRDESFEEYYKVILPKELVKDYKVEFTLGNHGLIYDHNKYDGIINRVTHPDLRLAHFPIRSKGQTISKVTVGWIYNLYRPGRRGSDNAHFKIIFDKLKENEDLKNEDITNFAKKYALKSDEKDVNLKEDPMDLTFCNDIKMKYTDDKINPISDLLESCEWLATDSANYMRKSLAEEEKLKTEIEYLSNSRKESHLEEQRLKSKIQEYENSNSWKITAPLRGVVGKIRNFLN